MFISNEVVTLTMIGSVSGSPIVHWNQLVADCLLFASSLSLPAQKTKLNQKLGRCVVLQHTLTCELLTASVERSPRSTLVTAISAASNPAVS